MTQTNRDGLLTLRIAASLHETLKDTAERSGQTVSDVARDILVDAMADEVVRQREPSK
jgi:hypothetical protein